MKHITVSQLNAAWAALGEHMSNRFRIDIKAALHSADTISNTLERDQLIATLAIAEALQYIATHGLTVNSYNMGDA